jgi:hypothetical protein
MTFLTPPPLPPNYSDMLAVLAGIMNKKYLHISFHFPPPLSELEATHHIQPIINTADDWLKYTGNCWIVWSSLGPKQWFEKFEAVPELIKCSILIVKLDLTPDNRAGQLPQWVWDWIQKTRT